ncbi:MAG: hypothetical protein SXA11_08055 [Cyanobacteriota bacterium]|nr:hypothetical protein [Cyanobacteriota bacterium]
MANKIETKTIFIKSVNVLLALSALALVFGFIIWFLRGTLMVTELSEEILDRGWGAVLGFMSVLLSFVIPTMVALFGFAIMALLIWWLSRIFSQYEEFQPTSIVVYQMVAPVGFVAGLILASPVLISYATLRLFQGNGKSLMAEFKEASNMLFPEEAEYIEMAAKPKVKLLAGNSEKTDS